MTKELLDKKNKIFGVVEGFYGRPWTLSQRKELFKRMKSLGLNTYMYAPKDDFKHRAYWRELYSVEEAEQLSSLIASAKENQVNFFYAISPGLDMTYSNSKDVVCLKRKLEQVAQFGCEAFALLFDDIEPEISEVDKEVYQSLGHAQVSVTNEIYQAIGQPKFLFCPTEYCTTRAHPNICNSEYLNTLGNKLMPDIDVMWTGNKVISKILTIQSLQELTEVLKRQPVIWDNIHANDYDQKRIFLGPYSGRSTDIIPCIRGVLTNPNCEFEANFIALHTISQWTKCNEDAKCDLSAISSDIKLESESDYGLEDVPSDLSPNLYHPKRALRLAIEAWLPEFNKTKAMFPKPNDIISTPLSTVVNNLSSTNQIVNDLRNEIKEDGEQMPIEPTINAKSDLSKTELNENSNQQFNLNSELDLTTDSSFQPLTKELTNSLVNPPVVLNPLEPMDCGQSPLLSPKISDENMEESLKSENLFSSHTNSSEFDIKENNENKNNDSSSEEMQTENENDLDNLITYNEVSFLVDLFYLPFEHGHQGLQILSEFYWLVSNSHLVSNFKARKNHSDSEKSSEIVEWFDRANKLEKTAQFVGKILTKLTFCKNQCLLYEMYPYLWDIKGVISLLNSYIKWLSLGKIPLNTSTYLQPSFTWFSKGYKEAFSNGEQEPWLFRGGLSGDLQRLLPVENVNDLFLYKPPESPSSHIYTIRPYVASDEQSVYEICNKTSNANYQINLKEFPNLLGDKFVGSFLTLSADFCFVVEDEVGICGYILAAPDSRKFQKKIEMAWIPEICSKYPAPTDKLNKGEELTFVEQIINSFHEEQKNCFTIPEIVYNDFPSIFRMNLLNHNLDSSVPKQLLTCLLAALKANGSKGLFSTVNNVYDKNIIDFYLKLGFQEIHCPSDLKLSKDDVFLGRMI